MTQDYAEAVQAARDLDDDGITVRLRSWAVYQSPMIRIRIGDTLYEFPFGTTREQAQSVLDEAKRRYRAMCTPP